MKLLVDIGNSRVKWACSDNQALSGHGSFTYTQETLDDLLTRHWRALNSLRQVYVASVADVETTAGLLEYIRTSWTLEPRLAVTEKERAGLRNAYLDVTTMGVDRWLAMLAAWVKYGRPVCVIDCGTAVTVDIILDGGRHAGGFILPGASLMSTTLVRETHGIQAHGEIVPELEFGRSTAACIRNGFAFALSGLVDKCAGKIRKEEGHELLFVVTGGAAELAFQVMPGRYIHEPYLVLEGLRLISQS